MEKVITFAVPCYNSAAYMDHCVSTLLTAGVFAVLSVRNPLTVVDGGVLSALSENFSLHPLALLPAACMLALPLLRVPVKWAMALSAAIALVLTVWSLVDYLVKNRKVVHGA